MSAFSIGPIRTGGGPGIATPPPIAPTATGEVAQLRTSLKGALTWSKLSGASSIAIAASGVVTLSAALGSGGAANAVVRVQNATGDAIERALTLRAIVAPTPTPTPTPAAVRIAAAGGLFHRGTATGAFTRNETRRQIVGGSGTLAWIKLVYANVYCDATGERSDGLATLNLSAAVELASPATTVQATFAGQPTIALAPGDIVESDPIPATAFGLTAFPSAFSGFARTGTTFTSGSRWPACIPSSTEAKSSNATVSQILATGALVTPSGGSSSLYGLVPIAIIGQYVDVADVAVLVVGDSIFMSSNDIVSGDLAGTGGGVASRGMVLAGGRVVPHTKTSIFGQGAIGFDPTTNGRVRAYLMQYATHLLEDLGTNDDPAAATAVYAAKQGIWAAFRARAIGPKRVAVTTLLPRTTGSWGDAASQTPRSGWAVGGVFRDALNGMLRGGVGAPDGPSEVIETGAAVQDATQPDRWITNGTAGWPTTDGLHPSVNTAPLAAAAIRTVAGAWTT